jgi:transcriptional regulator with XRE-family HTH domain
MADETLKVEGVIEAVRTAMDRQRLTARDLAEKTGRTEQEIGQWLRGGRVPNFTNLQVLTGAVGLELVLRKVRGG